MVMVTGALIAGATDLTFSLPGYIWVAICAVSTAVYLLLIRLLKDKTGETRALSHCDLSAAPACKHSMSGATDTWT